jgi:membrane-bound metal-dependent hydrolase YbcI (DUF457 family)
VKGSSHIATNIFSAVAVNSFFHIVDKSYSWHQLMQLVGSPQLDVALHSEQFLHKLTYYVIVICCARLPDIDQRVSWIGRLSGGHRGCTHSCLSIILLVLFALLLCLCLPMILLAHGIVISPLVLEEGKVILKAMVLGWTLHLLADAFTRGGIPLFWPVPMRLGIPPISALRFKVGTIREDIMLWSIIALVSFAIGASMLGL